MSRALVDILTRRWGLGEKNRPVVVRLIEAWEFGHTGVRLDKDETKRLASQACVSVDPKTPAPLMLKGDLLRSWQHASAEKEVIEGLLDLAGRPARKPGKDALEALKVLGGDDLDQARAADLGLEKSLVLVTGGPGTGKTHTAARMLGLMLEDNPDLRFSLAAPTGKAAQRLAEGVVEAVEDSRVKAALKRAIVPLRSALKRSSTLHRLLGWRPEEDRCARRENHPLALDVLIVDEASMMDLMMWKALLRALPAGCRLVVLGDPLQLESIEPGRVLADLVDVAATEGPLKECRVQLQTNYRYREYPAIGAVAKAVRKNDSDALLAAAPVATEGEAFRIVVDPVSKFVDRALDTVWPQVLRLARATEATQALEALADLRILTALNKGRWGVWGVNNKVKARLAEEGLDKPARPCLVKVNDPYSGLFNGDLGVILPDGKAVFPGSGKPRVYPAGQLPQSEDAWAITVHRSQGSEYGTLLLILPLEALEPRELVGPELIYTAVTRARKQVILAASEKALREGCKKRPARVTGLATSSKTL